MPFATGLTFFSQCREQPLCSYPPDRRILHLTLKSAIPIIVAPLNRLKTPVNTLEVPVNRLKAPRDTLNVYIRLPDRTLTGGDWLLCRAGNQATARAAGGLGFGPSGWGDLLDLPVGHRGQPGEYLRSISEDFRSLSEHLRSLPGHLRSLPGHLRSLSEHLRSLSEHLRSLSEHLRSLSEHLRSLSGYLRSLSEHLRSLTRHLRSLTRSYSPR